MAPDEVSVTAGDGAAPAKKSVTLMEPPRAALRMQAFHRGNLSRSGKLKLGAPQYTSSELRRLEDALSVALNASMSLDASEGRLGFIARHLAATEHGRAPPESPPRVGRLTDEQKGEAAALMELIGQSVEECNFMFGSPLRNVAEHLFAQHRALRAQPQTKENLVQRARRLGMRTVAAQHRRASFKNLPAAPTPEQVAKAEAEAKEAEDRDPLVVQAKLAAQKAFAGLDGDGSGELDKDELFQCLLDLGQVPGTSKRAKEAYLAAEFLKADQDGSGTVDYDECGP